MILRTKICLCARGAFLNSACSNFFGSTLSAAITPQEITRSAKQLLNQSEEVIRIAVAPQITMNIQWGKWGEYYYLEANTFSPKEFMSVIEETGGANAPPTIGLKLRSSP
jgi:hypothetical protein